MACNDIGLQSMQPRREREKERAPASELQGRVIVFAGVSGSKSRHLGQNEPHFLPPPSVGPVSRPFGAFERADGRHDKCDETLQNFLVPMRKKGRSGGGREGGEGAWGGCKAQRQGKTTSWNTNSFECFNYFLFIFVGFDIWFWFWRLFCSCGTTTEGPLSQNIFYRGWAVGCWDGEFFWHLVSLCC